MISALHILRFLKALRNALGQRPLFVAHLSPILYIFTMAIFRQYIAPLLIVLVFVVALVAVGARIFLPDDMAAPRPN